MKNQDAVEPRETAAELAGQWHVFVRRAGKCVESFYGEKIYINYIEVCLKSPNGNDCVIGSLCPAVQYPADARATALAADFSDRLGVPIALSSDKIKEAREIVSAIDNLADRITAKSANSL